MTALDRLKLLCLATTQPGPWSTMTTDGKTTVVDANGFWVAEVGPAPLDAAYIAALSPDVALKLIAVVEAAVKVRDEWLGPNAGDMTVTTPMYIALNKLGMAIAAIDAVRKEVG